MTITFDIIAIFSSAILSDIAVLLSVNLFVAIPASF